jgi:hypothetical protein
MPGVSNSDLADLIATTLANLPKLDLEWAFKYQKYEVLDRWFQKDRVEFESGTEIKRNIVLDESGNARHVKLYEEDTINVVDLQSRLTVPWVQAQTQWSIERREGLRNRAPARFVALLSSRRNEAMLGLANILEGRGWQSPNNSSDDLNPYGLRYWIPKLVSGQAGEGFYGGSDTNVASTTAGIDPATSGDNTTSIAGGKPYWRSYAAGGTAYYEAMNATALRTMAKMFLSINFQSPFLVKDMQVGPTSGFRIYCNMDTYVALSELARQQNDQVGADLARYMGITIFNRVPIIFIPYLDADTDNPVYMVNHNKFKPFVQRGDYFRETPAMNDRRMHNVFTTFVDLSYNYLCTNRRQQGVMSLAL